jgi:hypothetical protein
MNMKAILLLIPVLLLDASCVPDGKTAGITWYIDAEAGDDNNSGKNESKAWKSLAMIRSIPLHAGDAVLLKGGQVHRGTIVLKNLKGMPGLPVILSSYGGKRATIDSGDSLAILVENGSHISCSNVVLTGSGRLAGNITDGILFRNVHYGVIDSLESSGYLMSGIHVLGGSNLRITNAFAHDNGFCGIFAESGEAEYGPPDGLAFKTLKQLYIGHCVAENNPGCPAILDNHSGNGILIAGVTGGIIEHCEAMNNGWDMPREGNGPVGIWAYMSDSVIIQHCYAHHNKTSPRGKDGGGFDFDGGMRNSIMQYNLSAFNEGAGYGIFQYAGATSWTGNTVRYNISYHDGGKNSHAGIFMWCDPAAMPMQHFHAYNNTVVNRYGLGVNFEPGAYADFVFENNIFLVTAGSVQFVGGDFTLASFNNNLYWSPVLAKLNRKLSGAEIDSAAWVADPGLMIPDESSGLVPVLYMKADPEFFRLLPGSPGLRAGNVIQQNGGVDYWGNRLPSNGNPNIGAWQ